MRDTTIMFVRKRHWIANLFKISEFLVFDIRLLYRLLRSLLVAIGQRQPRFIEYNRDG